MEKLQKLKTDKSPGPDDIHPLLLKEYCASVIAEPLSLIFQQSFDTGIPPTDWKTANIVPIFKKGNRTDKSNYRPVSLTSVPSKIMESIMDCPSLKKSSRSFLNRIIYYAGLNTDFAAADPVSLPF